MILFLSSLFLTRFAKDVTTINKSLLNTNILLSDYESSKPDILKYRIGKPRFEYKNQNAPYSNSYTVQPASFIPAFRQPIDGIVPANYKSTIGGTNVMFGNFETGCKENCIDMGNDYLDLLNLQTDDY